ncbi:MAG: GAF domain-containing protein [Desulfomonile sp.]|nr:GAF domain-containing protein [Desulfomonile sp.]
MSTDNTPKRETADDRQHGAVSPEDQSAAEVRLDAGKLTLLYNAAKALAFTTDLDHLLDVIVGEVRKMIGCEGCAVVLHDEERDDFYWRKAQDPHQALSTAREDIRIPKGQGVVGWVLSTGRPALINDAANDPRVYRTVEDVSGFHAHNMIVVPLKARDKALGVLYALNKIGGPFIQEDLKILSALSINVALALENAASYDALVKSHNELQRLNLVKNKTLNHLSHELKTPLAIIEASLKILERKLRLRGVDLEGLPMERIYRNLGRLQIIERQVAHIVEEKDYPERTIVSNLLERLKDLIEIREEEEPALADAMEAIKRKIEELFPERIEEKEGIDIASAFEHAQSLVERMTRSRALNIRFVSPDPALIMMQPQILKSVLDGLIRNAIENTPDHGTVEVTGERTANGYRIVVRDCGVGIPDSEQPNIFEAFYPVQETDLYSSRSRYDFNAGGTGTDLLKIKIFAERFGFTVRFTSTRCSLIPTARDLCPGDITRCSCCKKIEDCLANGGTQFIVEIPERLLKAQAPPEAAA